jgi:hypothetical protein
LAWIAWQSREITATEVGFFLLIAGLEGVGIGFLKLFGFPVTRKALIACTMFVTVIGGAVRGQYDPKEE